VELLILVTPEFVDAIGPGELPCGGPGFATVSPTNRDLYCGGHVEVPQQCNPIRDFNNCNDDCCNNGCGPKGCSSNSCGNNFQPANGSIITDSQMLPGGTGYDTTPMPTPAE